MREEHGAAASARKSELPGSGDRVDSALGADAPVALKDFLSQVSRLGAQLPLVDTEVRAEGEAPARDFKRAPSAESAAVRSTRKGFAVDPTALHDASRAHRVVLIE